MKICQFCGTEQNNDAVVCLACGGNEFSYKCRNCGNTFDEGTICPVCGVHVDTCQKTCPRCGRAYYTVQCPDCGYIGADNAAVGDAPAQTPKKRMIWLWVLGFLFIFPVPVTVLVARSKKIPAWGKAAIIALVWIFFILIGYYNGDEASGLQIGAAVQTVQVREVSFPQTDEPGESLRAPSISFCSELSSPRA